MEDTSAPRWMSSSLKSEPKICVSLAPKSLGEASALIAQAEKSEADYIELRLDGLREGVGGLRAVLKDVSKPLVLTYRSDPKLSLGARIDPQELEQLFEHAEYVDLDMPSWKKGVRRIASIHLWRSITFEEGASLAEAAWSQGCDLVKLVFLAEKHEDNLTALRLASTLKMPAIVFCMGELGVISRVLTPLCGSKWTYASLRPGLETAPGQLDVATLRGIYRLLGDCRA